MLGIFSNCDRLESLCQHRQEFLSMKEPIYFAITRRRRRGGGGAMITLLSEKGIEICSIEGDGRTSRHRHRHPLTFPPSQPSRLLKAARKSVGFDRRAAARARRRCQSRKRASCPSLSLFLPRNGVNSGRSLLGLCKQQRRRRRKKIRRVTTTTTTTLNLKAGDAQNLFGATQVRGFPCMTSAI